MSRSSHHELDLQHFIPYLLNIAAEETSLGFRNYYKAKYGMLRTEWRVLFHLGCYGSQTAKQICDRASLHKTKVSRAVAKLEEKRLIQRQEMKADRRHELLDLTRSGLMVFKDLRKAGVDYQNNIIEKLPQNDVDAFYRCLKLLSEKAG